MLRTHTCGELRLAHTGQTVTLCGWVHHIRDKGGILWIDLRDRYGITQLLIEEAPLMQQARALGREYVIQAQGLVTPRQAQQPHKPTGEIEIRLQTLTVLNPAQVPPFLIETETDGKENLRMAYRYLDLRRAPLQHNLWLRHTVMQETRAYLNQQAFIEIETPLLIKATPEGARDFVVPARLHPGQYYALPQSPQLFKQLLMIAGFDRYYQLVRCFRDEDFRADRQPEFTQIDCELSFVTQDDIFTCIEGLLKHLFLQCQNTVLPPFLRMTYDEALHHYGTDQPDLRFGMPLVTLTAITQGHGFRVFDDAERVVGICAPGCAPYTRKQLDQLTALVHQLGAKGLVYVKYHTDGTFKSSVDAFFPPAQLATWGQALQAQPGDLLLLLAGPSELTRKAMAALRLHLGDTLGLRDKTQLAPVWITDFPWVVWDPATHRYQAVHHPFTAPIPADRARIASQPEAVRAQAYDLVINGVEIGGGSIRICERAVQEQVFRLLGLSDAEMTQQFGFLLDALAYGAPPHAGIALGLDRLCALLAGEETIRAVIAFPKNSSGRDVMIQAPAPLL